VKPKVLLRDVEPADLPLFFEHQRDPVAVDLVVFRSRERAEFDAHWAKILANETALTKTIVADGEVVGHIASFLRDGKREVGYWIDRAFWGRGIASEALPMFLRLEQTRPLFAGVAPHNLASLRVLQKCGFTLPSSSVDHQSEADGGSHIVLTLTEQPQNDGSSQRPA
jgi:RimJ/RimL family protein N-acetyltransferase